MMEQDKGSRGLIQKPLIVELDEIHNEYKYVGIKLYQWMMRVYLVIGVIWILLTWKMFQLGKGIKQIQELISSHIQLSTEIFIDNNNIGNNNVSILTLVWWLLHSIVLIMIVYLVLKYKKIVKQVNKRLKIIILLIWTVTILLVLRDLIAVNIIDSIGIKQPPSLDRKLQNYTQTQSTITIIKHLKSTSQLLYIINLISFIINPVSSIFLSYLFYKLNKTQQKCLSIISTLKNNNLFDIQSIQLQQPSIQLNQSHLLQNNHSQTKFRQQTSHNKQENLTTKNKQNKNIQMVQFRNGFYNTSQNQSLNIKLNIQNQQQQQSHTQSTNSIGKLHQIPSQKQYLKPFQNQTRTHQNLSLYQSQIKNHQQLFSKSYNNITKSFNNITKFNQSKTSQIQKN